MTVSGWGALFSMHELTTSRIMTQLHTSRMSILYIFRSISYTNPRLISQRRSQARRIRRSRSYFRRSDRHRYTRLAFEHRLDSVFRISVSLFVFLFVFFFLNHGRQRIPPSCVWSSWFWFPTGSSDILLLFLFSYFFVPTS
jgi:hypothetical protein